MRTLRWSLLAVGGLFALAVGTPAGAQQVEVKPTAKVKHDKYVITKEEIAEHPEVKDGYDVVRLLRNQWLRVTRGSGSALGGAGPAQSKSLGGCNPRSTDPNCPKPGESPGPGGSSSPVPSERGTPYAESGAMDTPGLAGPVLYIDEVKQDKLDLGLRTLRPADIFEIKFMTGNQAVGRYGSGHENGAILVTTARIGRG